MQEVSDPLPVGAVIQERYIVESLLGKGGFGSIYLVRKRHNKQKLFALAEVINPNEQARHRFTLEYISLKPLRHRALPHVQYVVNDDRLSRAYLLMSYIEKPNLEILRLQQPEKRFPLPQVMAVMAPVINAVTHLHHRRPPVIHRNIKPAIIIVPPRVDEPVLVMLDIVTEHDSTTTTLHYFAPGYGATEQYREEFSTRTDIYGLGATCYTLLTGIIPPDALYRSTQLSNGKIDPLKPVNEVIPAIPTFMAEAIQRAMSINAYDRFSSVERFREALWSPRRQFSLRISHSVPSPSAPSLAASRQTVKKPASVPKQPRAPRSWKPGTLWPLAFRQVVKRSATASASVPKQPRASRPWKLGALLIVLAFLINLGIGTVFWPHTPGDPATYSAVPTPGVKSSTPTPTSVSSIYPTLTGTYNGTIYDISVNVSTSMSLSGIRQSQGNISGYLTLGPKLQDGGPFSGTIDTAGDLQFTVTDTAGNPTLFFKGVMQSVTNLSGDYYRCRPVSPAQRGRCSQAPGSYGVWNAVLTLSGQSSKESICTCEDKRRRFRHAWRSVNMPPRRMLPGGISPFRAVQE